MKNSLKNQRKRQPKIWRNPTNPLKPTNNAKKKQTGERNSSNPENQNKSNKGNTIWGNGEMGNLGKQELQINVLPTEYKKDEKESQVFKIW